jgi:hypothetical protein
MTAGARQLRPPAVLACLLALLLLYELLPARGGGALPAIPDRRIAATADDTAARAAGWAALILARPLFRADRRPLAVLTTGAGDETPPRLSAIVITATGSSAIFINADGSASVLAAGGHDGAFEVRAITPDSVRLDGPAGGLTLHPQFAAGAAAASATGAPGATAAAPARNRFDESDQ